MTHSHNSHHIMSLSDSDASLPSSLICEDSQKYDSTQASCFIGGQAEYIERFGPIPGTEDKVSLT